MNTHIQSPKYKQLNLTQYMNSPIKSENEGVQSNLKNTNAMRIRKSKKVVTTNSKASLLQKWLCITPDKLKNNNGNNLNIKVEAKENYDHLLQTNNGSSCHGNNNSNETNKCGNVKNKMYMESYLKYGVRIPSNNDIINSQENYKKFKESMVNLANIFSKDLSKGNLNVDSKPDKEHMHLNCENLSLEEIKELFKNNLNYIIDISNGTRYSERHERFKNQRFSPDVDSLNYNTSMIVFKTEQKLKLAALLEKHLPDNIRNNHYIFQVLLPELCLKIFMDHHHMTYDDAIAYLDARPVDI